MTQTIKRKVYFSADKIALGTSEGPEAFYSDYYASEFMRLFDTTLVKGLSYKALLAIQDAAVTQAVQQAQPSTETN